MPKSVDLIFCEAEYELICAATAQDGKVNWDCDTLYDLKRRIKDHLYEVTSGCCCYCWRSISNDHRMTIDVEHVLPKCKFFPLTFHMLNLSLSCRKCNFFKHIDWNFVWNKSAERVVETFDQSTTYEIIHPNLDHRCDHMRYVNVQINDAIAVAYCPLSAKGVRTYEYFGLGSIEVDCLDDMQNASTQDVAYFRTLIERMAGV